MKGKRSNWWKTSAGTREDYPHNFSLQSISFLSLEVGTCHLYKFSDGSSIVGCNKKKSGKAYMNMNHSLNRQWFNLSSKCHFVHLPQPDTLAFTCEHSHAQFHFEIHILSLTSWVPMVFTCFWFYICMGIDLSTLCILQCFENLILVLAFHQARKTQRNFRIILGF